MLILNGIKIRKKTRVREHPSRLHLPFSLQKLNEEASAHANLCHVTNETDMQLHRKSDAVDPATEIQKIFLCFSSVASELFVTLSNSLNFNFRSIPTTPSPLSIQSSHGSVSRAVWFGGGQNVR